IMLEKLVDDLRNGRDFNVESGITYLNTLLGRTYDQVLEAYNKFENSEDVNNLFEIVYDMGRISIDEYLQNLDREITFSPALRESLGHHVYGERWANNIKQIMWDNDLYGRPIHIISANLHSVMN